MQADIDSRTERHGSHLPLGQSCYLDSATGKARAHSCPGTHNLPVLIDQRACSAQTSDGWIPPRMDLDYVAVKRGRQECSIEILA